MSNSMPQKPRKNWHREHYISITLFSRAMGNKIIGSIIVWRSGNQINKWNSQQLPRICFTGKGKGEKGKGSDTGRWVLCKVLPKWRIALVTSRQSLVFWVSLGSEKKKALKISQPTLLNFTLLLAHGALSFSFLIGEAKEFKILSSFSYLLLHPASSINSGFSHWQVT